MSAYRFGIDPGRAGGVVGLDEEGHCVMQVRLATLRDKRAPYLWDRAKVREVVKCIAGHLPRVAMEAGGYFGRDSARTAFGAGVATEIWLSALDAEGIVPTLVGPADWHQDVLDVSHSAAIRASKRGLKLAKSRALYVAQTVPNLDLTPGRCTVPQDGLADALCIALHRAPSQLRARILPKTWPEDLR